MQGSIRTVSIAIAAFVGAWLATPTSVDAACGGGGDSDLIARFVRNHAEIIVHARVASVDPSGIAHLDVLHVYRGSASTTIELEDESLPCHSFSSWMGDRVVLAIGTYETDDPSTIPTEAGAWAHAWHFYPGYGWQAGMTSDYRSLDDVLRALDVLPDTSVAAARATAGGASMGVGPDASVLVGVGSLAWMLFAFGWRRRTRGRL